MIALAATIVLLVIILIDNVFGLFVTKVKLAIADCPETLKILVLSDLHCRKFGKNNSRLINIASRQAPDCIALCGDMVSRNCIDFRSLEHLLHELCKIAPVFYSLGNHELGLKNIDVFLETVAKTPVILLDNKSVTFRGFTVTGITLNKTNYRKNNKFHNLDFYGINDIESAVGSKKVFTVLLAHNPFFAETYAEWGADVVLSGHVHGGVVRFFGRGLLSPERKFFPKYSGGVHKYHKTLMFVSRGLGKLRLFNPPEMVLISVLKA
jgi:predicted MPP superfamily phosphohydrolase